MAPAGPLPGEQRGHDAGGQAQRSRMIGNEGTCRNGRILRHPGLGHQSARRLGQDVAAGARRPWSFRTPRAGLAKDKFGIDPLQLLEAQPTAIQDAGPIVGQQHVIAARKLLDDFHRLGLPQVERDAAFAAVHRDKIVRNLGIFRIRPADHLGKHPAAGVTGPALFDLGHAGAEIGEKQRRKRALDFLPNFQHLDSIKRLAHVNPLAVIRSRGNG